MKKKKMVGLERLQTKRTMKHVLADQMSKVAYCAPFYQSKEIDSEDETRTTRNISSRIPGYGVFNFCFSYPKKDE